MCGSISLSSASTHSSAIPSSCIGYLILSTKTATQNVTTSPVTVIQSITINQGVWLFSGVAIFNINATAIFFRVVTTQTEAEIIAEDIAVEAITRCCVLVN